MVPTPTEFERIMMPHTPVLLRFARRLTGGAAVAEDLVQETLLRAWRGARQFQEGTNARAWLFQILMNVFHGERRKIHAAPAIEVIEGDVAGTFPAVVARLELVQVFARLPEEHRTVLLLAVVEGFTCREAAEILGLPMGTVMSRLSRARHSLREALSRAAKPERALVRMEKVQGVR